MGLLLCYIVLFSEIKLEKYVCESKYVRPFLWTGGCPKSKTNHNSV